MCAVQESAVHGEQDEESLDGYRGDDTATASQVRKHYEKKFRDRHKSEAGEPATAPEPAAVTPFQGSISSVFSAYLQYACSPAFQSLRPSQHVDLQSIRTLPYCKFGLCLASLLKDV